MPRFFAELKRRRVYQTAGLYIVGAWAALQVADLAFESWGIPDAALQSVWILALVLFPAAILFGWRYDLTASGIVRTPRSENEAEAPLTRSDVAVIGSLGAMVAIAAVVFLVNLGKYPEPFADGPTVDIRSIAVLPFRSIGGGDETLLFSDGVHDDLLTRLANIDDLKVISRTSVMQYRDSQRNLREIGRELGAAHILEGGVQQVGNQVRINVQLINAQSDDHVWAENYDRAMTIHDLFAIQSEIAQTIAEELAVTLSAKERKRVTSERTDNLAAFEAFNRGKQNFVRQTFEALRNSVVHFEEAIELDPDYFLARVMLARAYAGLVNTGAEPLAYALDNGRQHIDYAIEMDPESPHAIAVLADYQSAIDAANVEELFEQAISLGPNDVDVLDIYATYLRNEGRFSEALEITERAMTYDPLSTALWHDFGRAKIAMGQFEEANVAFRRIAQIDPKNPYASHGAALASILSGQLVEGAYWAEINAATDVNDYENTSTLANIYMTLGDFANARRAIDESLQTGPTEPMPLSVEALFLTMNEQRDVAVGIARSALVNDLANRWGSERVFLRTLRDEALETGMYDEAIGWYRRRQPDFFEETPLVIAPNVQRAADLGGLLLAAGQVERGHTVLNAAIADYDLEYVRGAANFPMGIAKAEALAMLGNNDAAITELQRVVDDGWRLLWQWDTHYNPAFDGLRDDPRFRKILEFIDSDLSRQAETFQTP